MPEFENGLHSQSGQPSGFWHKACGPVVVSSIHLIAGKGGIPEQCCTIYQCDRCVNEFRECEDMAQLEEEEVNHA